MARKAMAAATVEKLATRLAFLSVAVEQGNKAAATKAETIVWTLNTLGFDESVINDVTARAEELASDISDNSDV